MVSGYSYTIAMRYHLNHPLVVNLSIRNSQLPQDTVPGVECIMLHFLCLILRPAWKLEILLNPVNGIDHPVIELKNDKGKSRILPLVQFFLIEKIEDSWIGVVPLTEVININYTDIKEHYIIMGRSPTQTVRIINKIVSLNTLLAYPYLMEYFIFKLMKLVSNCYFSSSRRSYQYIFTSKNRQYLRPGTP